VGRRSENHNKKKKMPDGPFTAEDFKRKHFNYYKFTRICVENHTHLQTFLNHKQNKMQHNITMPKSLGGSKTDRKAPRPTERPRGSIQPTCCV